MIDSHCHLADVAYAADLAAVVARAHDAGVAEALCILSAVEADEAERARGLSSLWPAIAFAVGVHPHTAHEFAGRPEAAAARVRQAVDASTRVRAIGEIGLDYYYDFSPPAIQRDVFGRQIRLARELDLPVVIHTREADADTIAILQDEGGGQVRGIFHCFTGDAAMAARVVELGFHVSFSGIVTFPRAAGVREAAAVVPGDRLLVETDCPYLAPVPHRGKRNEPAWVMHVAATVAETRGESAEALRQATTEAFRRLIHPTERLKVV